MTRKRDYLREPDLILHAYNRGAGQKVIFQGKSSYVRFTELLVEVQKTVPVSVLVHTLMPTHFHLVLHQHEPFAISEFLRNVCQEYSHWLNGQAGRKGTNFEGRYGGIRVGDPEGFLRLAFYVLTNALEAKLAPSLEAWPYSSHENYLHTTNGNPNGHSLLLNLVGGVDGYERFMKQYNAGNPDSVGQFLCPDCTSVWSKRGMAWRQQTNR